MSAVPADEGWHEGVENFVQAIIRNAYGCIAAAELAAAAAALRPPRTPLECAAIRGVVLECMMQRLHALSAREAEHFIVVLEEVSRTREANLVALIAAVRALLELPGTDMADRIRHIIDKRYAERLRMDELASELGIPTRHVDGEFRRQFAMSVRQYQKQRRVAEGLAMIRAGDKIEAVALAVGYKSKRHFYRAVRETTGVTPGAYRLRCQTQALGSVATTDDDS